MASHSDNAEQEDRSCRKRFKLDYPKTHGQRARRRDNPPVPCAAVAAAGRRSGPRWHRHQTMRFDV